MDDIETLIFLLSGLISGLFLYKWYKPVIYAWPAERGKPGKAVLGALPAVAFLIFFFTLKTLASFDVVDDPFFILFYLLLGFAWLYLGERIMACVFDLSRIDDILNMNNQSALFAFTGGFIGVVVIYSAANIGDGPGWWCVVFAGALGLVAWISLALIADASTRIIERITIERSIPCGVRFGCYLLGSGVILGRASAGDWTSASRTVAEFMDGWPALLLALIFIARERISLHPGNEADAGEELIQAALWGAMLVLFGIISVFLLPPTVKNPFYG